MDPELKKIMDELKELTPKLHAAIESAEKAGKNVQRESTERIEALQKALDAAEERYKARFDEVMTKLNRPGQEGTEGKKPEVVANEKAYGKFLRKGEDSLSPEEAKALTVDQDPSGGYMVPATRSATIIKKLIEFSPMRELASIVTISVGDSYEEPVEGATDFDAGWIGERSARPETTSGKLLLEKVPVHELYANPFVSQKMLDDAAFDVEGWLADRVGMRFAVKEGAAFISGDGVGKPEGIINKVTAGPNSGSSGAVTADGLISLAYDLPEFYAKNATFLMRRATVAAVRKLKDSANQYLWAAGFAGSLPNPSPATILGYPYREAIDMPVIAAAAKAIVFGDIRSAYRIVDRVDIRVLRDPYSNKPHVAFYTTKRVGGQVVLPEAARSQTLS